MKCACKDPQCKLEIYVDSHAHILMVEGTKSSADKPGYPIQPVGITLSPNLIVELCNDLFDSYLAFLKIDKDHM
jgi:hypothetical protein